MKTTTGAALAVLWTLLGPSGVAAETTAPPSPMTLYVQVSGLNLRADSNPQAEVVRVVPIATTCQLLEMMADGWAHVSCSETEGYTKVDLLGPAKPELEPLLEKARQPGLPLDDRMNYALRAAALDSTSGPARDLVRQTFLENEFAALDRIRAKAAKHPRARRFRVDPWTWTCRAPDAKTCLEQMEGTFNLVAVRGEDVVQVRELKDELDWEVRAGKVVWNASGDTSTITFLVQNRYHTPPSPALSTALEGRPFDTARAERLKAAAEWAPLLDLPNTGWRYAIVEGDTAFLDCNAFDHLGIDVHSQDGHPTGASVEMGGDDRGGPEVYPVDHVAHPSRNRYVLTLGMQGKTRTMEIEYPPTDGPLAGRSNAAWFTDEAGSNHLIVEASNMRGVRREANCR